MRLATAACNQKFRNARRFTTVSDVRPARSDERVARRAQKFTFHHSFGRPTSTKCDEMVARAPSKFAFHHSCGHPTITFCVKGCSASSKICISPQFWASDDHFLREGFLGDMKNLHFTTVLSVRQAQSDEKVVSRGELPKLPCGKKRTNFKEEQQFSKSSLSLSSSSQQPFSAALLCSLSQQLFSAALLSSSSQQPFSSSVSQQLFSAALLKQPFSSSLSQQLFSSSFSQLSSCCGQGLVVSYYHHLAQLFSAIILLWSGVGGQLLSSFCTAFLSYHLAVVKGWWSAIIIILHSFSQLSSWCGQGLVVSYYHHLAVVRGWWSAIIIILHSFSQLSSCCGQGLVVSYYHHFAQLFSAIILLWSGVGGQLLSSFCTAFLSYHLAVVKGWWSAIIIILHSFSQLSSWCGQGLVVSYYHHLAVVRGWWSAIIIILHSFSQLSSCCGQGLVVSYYHHLAVVKGWWSSMLPFFRRILSQRFRELFFLKNQMSG